MCLSQAVKGAVRLPSDCWFIISQTQACQPWVLRHCAMHTDLEAQRKPAQLWHSAVPFAKLSQFILMTHGKSLWPIYEAVSVVSVSSAPLVHQAEIQVLQETTVWNLNISNLGKYSTVFIFLISRAIWDLANSSQGQRSTNAVVAWYLSQMDYF